MKKELISPFMLGWCYCVSGVTKSFKIIEISLVKYFRVFYILFFIFVCLCLSSCINKQQNNSEKEYIMPKSWYRVLITYYNDSISIYQSDGLYKELQVKICNDSIKDGFLGNKNQILMEISEHKKEISNIIVKINNLNKKINECDSIIITIDRK